MLTFYSDDPSLNSADGNCFFCKICILPEQKRGRDWPILKNLPRVQTPWAGIDNKENILFSLFFNFKTLFRQIKMKMAFQFEVLGLEPLDHESLPVFTRPGTVPIKTLQQEVVVAQLVERSLPIPEVRGLNPVIGKNLLILNNYCILSTVY